MLASSGSRMGTGAGGVAGGVVVGDGEGLGGAGEGALGVVEHSEGVEAAFVEVVAVDGEEVLAVFAGGDAVGVPDFGEEGAWHGRRVDPGGAR